MQCKKGNRLNTGVEAVEVHSEGDIGVVLLLADANARDIDGLLQWQGSVTQAHAHP